jgi:hypothetical protein
MPSIINATTTAGVAITGDNSGNLAIQTNNGNTAVTINTSLGVQVANCLGVGNATPSTSGAGITFPATQSASTDANTLDDYEEGTWSPSIVLGVTSPTYGNRLGTYTKIGRQVNFQFVLAMTGGTRNGSILTLSLPLVSSATSPARGFGAYWTYADTNVQSSSTTNLPFLYIVEGTTSLQLYTASGGNFAGTDLPSTIPSFYISGSYITD